MELNINRFAYPVSSLGPGQRFALWVQGCSQRCSGCASADTWGYNLGEYVDVEEFAYKVARFIVDEKLEGLSITGGEPIDQAKELIFFIKCVKRNVAQIKSDIFLDVLVFSGYKQEEVNKMCPLLFEEVDAMVCGPYDCMRPRKNVLVASDNQDLIIINNGIKKIYENYVANKQVSLQFDIDSSGISFIGMPNSGDLALIEKKLNEKGIVLGGKSWQK